MFKCRFLNKIGGMRLSGKRIEVLKMIDQWLEQNEDEICKDMDKTELMKSV